MEFEFGRIEDLKEFLSKFNVTEDKIDEFTKGNKLYFKGDDVFLIGENEEFDESEVYRDLMVVIKLRKLVPTFLLLEFIKENGDVLEESSYNRALKFTYGKGLENKGSKEGFYLIKHKSMVLGLCEVRKGRVINHFNVGEYLRES